VRQLTAAAGDGLLGSVGSPGQLETSLNSGYLVGPCNSYLEGPTPIFLASARAWRREPPTSSSLADEKRVGSLLLSTAAAPLPTLAADVCDLATLAATWPLPLRLAAAPLPTLAADVCDLATLAAYGPLPLRLDAAIVALPASKVAVGALSMGRMRANKQGACR